MTEAFEGCLGIFFAEFYLPQCHSLKMKRSILKKIQQRVRNDFNVSVAELEHQEKWQRSTLGFAMLGSEKPIIEKNLTNIRNWLESNFPEQLVRSTINFV